MISIGIAGTLASRVEASLVLLRSKMSECVRACLELMR